MLTHSIKPGLHHVAQCKEASAIRRQRHQGCQQSDPPTCQPSFSHVVAIVLRPILLPALIIHKPGQQLLHLFRIRLLRKFFEGDGQNKLAALLGRGRNAVSSWERGLSLPNVPRLLRMAKILGTLSEALYFQFYSTQGAEGELNGAAA